MISVCFEQQINDLNKRKETKKHNYCLNFLSIVYSSGSKTFFPLWHIIISFYKSRHALDKHWIFVQISFIDLPV